MKAAQEREFWRLLIARLRSEGKKAQARADACKRAIAALNGDVPDVAEQVSHISAKGKRNIREAQKARWQKFHKQQASLTKGK